MANPEKLLQEAIRMHLSGDFKRGIKLSEKARKEFLKQGNKSRAVEALRIMADCTVNARDLNTARNLYEQLLSEAQEMSNYFYQAAAYWGIGQVYSHEMNYSEAAESFSTGLRSARQIDDKWYTGWNAFGVGNACRGMGNLKDAEAFYNEAIEAFQSMKQPSLVSWVERALKDIGGEKVEPLPNETKIWLCPMCGSKFNLNQVDLLKNGKSVSCEYCRTSVG
ncbi:MAG: tetratricopeptide repeat protein [Candidatus Thorarchaeota archaeon]